MVTKLLKKSVKISRMTRIQKQAYEDMLMGRALRKLQTGTFVPVNEAVQRIRAGA